MTNPTIDRRPVVHLTIERLVLDGIAVSAAQKPVLRAALEAELARLFSQGGLSPALLAGGAVARLQAGVIQGLESHPQGMGQQIAQAVYGGITGDRGGGR
ncbi:MAG TPA: hypothetical protein VMT34_16930 [Aggregatilineales bacterium]|nr:hypothetical protein [Aggregatilineales bacterium]